MSAMASQITGVSIVCSTVCSGSGQRTYQSSASLAFVMCNSPVTGEFLAQKASNAENVTIWWRHHGNVYSCVVSTLLTDGAVIASNMLWVTIIHPCPNFNGPSYTLEHVWVITINTSGVVATYPCHNLDIGSAKRSLHALNTSTGLLI